MTSLVGILCKDGVVVGADSSATFGDGSFRTMEQPTRKLTVVGDSVIVAGTGQIGLGQRFCDVVEKAWAQKAFGAGTSSPQSAVSALDVTRKLCASSIQDFASTHVSTGKFGALLAFPFSSKAYLCEFAVQDFQPEMKTKDLWYCSMGCAQPITDPFLAFMRDVYWEDGPPSLQDAVFAVTWTLEHSINVNVGGVNGPVQIAVLERVKGKLQARTLSDDDLNEHRQNIDDVKAELRAFRDRHRTASDAAPLPRI